MNKEPHIRKDKDGREYIDYTVLFENMSDEELMDSFRAKDQLLHSKHCCHSVKDVRIYQELIRILDERGLIHYSKYADVEGRCGECGKMLFYGPEILAQGQLFECRECDMIPVTICPRCKCLSLEVHGEGISSSDGRHYNLESCTKCGYAPAEMSLGFRHVNTQNRTNLRCTYIRYTERYSVCVYKIGAILGLFYYADELLWDGYFKLF
jgi:hypothetical protein